VSGDLNGWWRLGVPLVVPIVRLLFRVRVAGIHHVPLEGPAVLAFNHISVLDGPCIAVESAWRRRRMTRFLVAAEIFRNPVIGWFLRRYRQIPIRRGQRDAGALDEAIATIRGGALAAIAPEGAVNSDPDHLQRIRSGIARVALPTGARVIPVGIWGTHRRGPRGHRTWGPPLRPGLGLAFGEPIAPEGDANHADDLEAFVDVVRSRLEEQVSAARVLAGQPRTEPSLD
jgi:1-acyl-sn-glycerol-3-phosphate acyltransferase